MEGGRWQVWQSQIDRLRQLGTATASAMPITPAKLHGLSKGDSTTKCAKDAKRELFRQAKTESLEIGESNAGRVWC